MEEREGKRQRQRKRETETVDASDRSSLGVRMVHSNMNPQGLG